MPFRDLPGVVQCRFHKGERLIRAGETMEYVYYLVKGSVYREVITDKGYESILSRKGGDDVANSLVGILTLYNRNSGNISNSDFIARTDCIAYRIPKEACQEYLRQHPILLEGVLCCAMDEYTRVLTMFNSRREGSGMARLCTLLLDCSKVLEDGRMAVPRKCTNVEISKLLSIHKVTVSRMMRALKAEGVVERTPDGLMILQPERMKQYATNEMVLEYE